MSGRAAASPFPPTHKINGQLLLELSGFAISDSLTTITSTQKDQKIEQQQTGAQLHNNYSQLHFLYIFEPNTIITLIVPTRPGQALFTFDGNTGVVSVGSSHIDKPGRKSKIDSSNPCVCSPLSKCLSALLLSAASVILRPFLHSVALRYQRDVRLFFCVRGYNSISGN